MKIILATGIYPPDIGGPATYVRALARELHEQGHVLTVITYGKIDTRVTTVGQDGGWQVVSVPWKGKPVLRWFLFARALRRFAVVADIIEAFSSVSVGVPLMLARLKKPKKILRLGGDFAWERYTDRGGMLSLKRWYEERFHGFVYSFTRLLVTRLLHTFDHIIFSSAFQKELYEQHYSRLPAHSVIENALPNPNPNSNPNLNPSAPQDRPHHPLRLLFVGRFVEFKNLPCLLRALAMIPAVRLTLVGDGPMRRTLERIIDELHLRDRVIFVAPLAAHELSAVFASHDLLILPSLTEISPNTALEARAHGLPVLLTEETGLSDSLRKGIVVRPLRSPEEIRSAVASVRETYADIALAATEKIHERSWATVAEEHLQLFRATAAENGRS
ncbi:MAG: glycosyltransferase family 4 protein [Candidatus Peregrinibacteria bacterium]